MRIEEGVRSSEERRGKGVSRKIYAFFASSRKKGDPRRYVPRVYEQGSPREREKGEIDFAGRNRPRRAMPSRERERERWRGEDREKKVIGEVRICVWLFPGNAARFIFIPRKTAPPLLELTFRGVSESGKKIASLHAIAFCLPSLEFEKRLVLLFQHKYLLPSFLLSSPLPSTPLMDLSETRRFL